MSGPKVPPMGRNDRIVFVPDHRSFGEFILSDQMRDAVENVAQDIAVHARMSANRDNEHKRRVHHYADMFKVKRAGGVLPVGPKNAPRVMVLVVNDDPVALYNEFGNRKTKRLRTLGRAGAAYGDFKPDGGLEA